MSIKERSLARINQAILNLHQREEDSPRLIGRNLLRIRRWGAMIQSEWVKNDVAIRAQSLSYFTLLSILPLFAGAFLILGFFSQWGPVQKEFEGLIQDVLGAIPADQRELLLGFMLQFKDQYLGNINKKSGSIGVFAVLVLLWISARVYFNIESFMNRIWSVRAERPWLERIRNFIVCMVLLPLAYALVISLPRAMEHFGERSVGLFFDQGLLLILIYSSLLLVFKFFPNTRVSWKSAHLGSAVGTIGYALSNSLLRVYFRVGTNTAYGKAAILPIFAFFIYAAWMIFIFAALVSLVQQQGARMIERKLPSSTLGQAVVLEALVRELQRRFQAGLPPETIPSLARALGIGEGMLESLIDFLERRGKVVRSIPRNRVAPFRCSLAHSVSEPDLILILQDFLNLERIPKKFDVFGLISRLKRT